MSDAMRRDDDRQSKQHGVAVSEGVRVADLGLLVVATAAAIPVFISGKRISRVEGALFLASYVGYMTWLLGTPT